MSTRSSRATSGKVVQWEEMTLFDINEIPTAAQTRANELAAWWMEEAAKEVANLVPKAINYGSVDLDIMGEAMLAMMPQLRGIVSGQELAIAFYLQGKISRLIGGYEQGVLPNRDTPEDIKIYAGMLLRVREAGKW